MDQDQETTTTTTNYKKYYKYSIWLVAAISILVVSSHNFFPSKELPVKLEEKQYKSFVELRKSSSKNIEQYYIENKNEVSEEFGQLLEEYFQNKKNADDQYSLLKSTRKENKILGFNSRNSFLFQTSIFFVMFMMAFVFKLINSLVDTYSLKRTLNSTTYIFLTISLYYLVWAFYDDTDLKQWQHLLCIVFIASSIAFASYHLFDWLCVRLNILLDHRNKIKTQQTIIDSTQLKVNSQRKQIIGLVDFVLDIRNNYFKKVAMTAMQTEENETLDTVIEFENKTEDELSKIVG